MFNNYSVLAYCLLKYDRTSAVAPFVAKCASGTPNMCIVPELRTCVATFDGVFSS